MRVAVIGAGYVGSVTGAAFAAAGHGTTIIDVDSAKVNRIRSGASPVYEPGLDEVIARTVREGTLSASDSFEAVQEADVVFIAVGTPSLANAEADMRYVEAAARTIGEQLCQGRLTVVVNKSTVPVGTAERVAELIREVAPNLREEEEFVVVSNPEFLREGYALQDVLRPDRIVIGTRHEGARRVMRALYEPFMSSVGSGPVYFETDTRSAEMIKYAANAFLAIKISYVNEIARLCERLGANGLDVAQGVGLDTRIGDKFLQISSGWSGSCFPKDTSELLATSRRAGSALPLVEAAVASNIAMHEFCLRKLERRLGTVAGKQIAILGLTFKPNTDDARNTQASYMIGRLLEMGAAVSAHDPQGMVMFRRLNGYPVRYCSSAEEAVAGADALVLLTHWEAYATLNWAAVRSAMRTPYVLDTRNFWRGQELAAQGLDYEGLGIGHR